MTYCLPVAERTAGERVGVDTLLFALDGRADSHRMTNSTTIEPSSTFGTQEADFEDQIKNEF